MRKDVNDVRVIRGAEIGSDHHLVLMKMKVRGREQNKKTEKKSRLRSEKCEQKKLKYSAALSHKLRVAKCVNGDGVEAAWNEFKRDILEVAEIVCGRKRVRKEKRTA